jgi:hypothetical protein
MVTENKSQARDLEILFGKFTGSKVRRNSVRHLSRIKKVINKLRDCYVIINQQKADKAYLLDQISQRDLMIDDCHETMLGAQDIIKALEQKVLEVSKERDQLKTHVKLEVVA